ncbi:MAG: EAL domain-containing protein [Burkholderiales bacterium]|nr:EAL domain-containing protein [Burkholderiales bacterium]
MQNDDLANEISRLLETFHTTTDDLLRRLDHLELSKDESTMLATLEPQLAPFRTFFSDALMAYIQATPELSMLTSDASLQRMREGHLRYFQSLTNGPYDEKYVHDRLRIGIIHQRLGLRHDWYLGAYRRYLTSVWPIIWDASGHNFEHFHLCISALLKIVLFDVGLALDAYAYAEKSALNASQSEVAQLQEQFQFQQKHDELTGLPNRRLLHDKLMQAVRDTDKNLKTFAVLHLGLNQFKLINDGLGYAVGNLVLKTLAERLRNHMHDADTVSYYGGDEFVVLLKNFDKTDDVVNICDRLAKVIAEPFQLESKQLHLSCCIGVALYPQDSERAEELSTFAEIALHRAKDIGQGSFQFYSTQMNNVTRARIDIASDLHDALLSDQLQLHYQPKADLQTGKVIGMEALIRWQHPVRGMISPSYFIPIAEDCGLIGKLGEWVLRQACNDIKKWIALGIQVPCIAINVSPRQLRESGFALKIESILQSMQVAPENISLEITESVLLHHEDAIANMLDELKRMGFSLSLDDFGTGYSALSYLKHFPFDYVKIDQSFVRELPHSTGDASISKAIIAMAHSLGIQVIAEGVEDEAQCEFLSANMCDQIQGFFFSKPLPPEKTLAFLKEGNQLERHLLRMETPERTLLLVDDEPNILAALKRLLRRDGYQILLANSGQEGLDMLEKHPVDVIISDQRMPGMTGVEFLRNAKKRYPSTVRIILSGYTELQYITDAINEGAIYKFLTKPWDDELIRANIQEAFHYKEMEDENRRLNLQIQTTNQELATANRQLADLLKQKQLQIKRDEISLNIVREVLQYVPLPLFAMDDEEMIVFINASAEALFPATTAVLGDQMDTVIPDISTGCRQCAEGQEFPVTINQQHYQAHWKNMGSHSESKGKIIILKNATSTV